MPGRVRPLQLASKMLIFRQCNTPHSSTSTTEHGVFRRGGCSSHSQASPTFEDEPGSHDDDLLLGTVGSYPAGFRPEAKVKFWIGENSYYEPVLTVEDVEPLWYSPAELRELKEANVFISRSIVKMEAELPQSWYHQIRQLSVTCTEGELLSEQERQRLQQLYLDWFSRVGLERPLLAKDTRERRASLLTVIYNLPLEARNHACDTRSREDREADLSRACQIITRPCRQLAQLIGSLQYHQENTAETESLVLLSSTSTSSSSS